MGRLLRYPTAVKPGARFGRLEVLGVPFRTILSERHHAVWCCVVGCECGTPAFVLRTCSITSGLTRSCGCLRRETTRRQWQKHGDSTSRLFRVWAGMIKRCGNSHDASFANYGGRGIAVCAEWLRSYATFRDWALASGYRDDLEIDRRDNDGPYSPENCRFVTSRENSRNTRRARLLNAYGESMSASAWADDPRCVVGYSTLMDRLKRGWDVMRALTSPVQR
jgi:hypothetical protein